MPPAATQSLDHRPRRWIAPPRLATRDLTRRAHTLWIIKWPFFAVVAVVLSIAVAVQPETLARRAITIGVVGLLVAALHELNRRGRTRQASWALVTGLTLIVTQRAWGTGGIHAPVAVFFVLFIIMAGVLLGKRGGAVIAGLSVACAIALVWAESRGLLIPRGSAGPASGAFVFVMLAVGLALVVQNLVARLVSAEPREDLVQMLVHDMRSPLTTLLTQLSLLREDAPGPMTPLVDEAMDGARNLNRLAANLLDVSRFEGRHMPIKRVPTDLAELADTVAHALRAVEPDRKIVVETVGRTICRCDPDVMRRVLENLVGNAIKHTRTTDQVRIRVESLQDLMRISVADDGPGIADGARGRIFERFSAEFLRTPSGYDSTGLGLAFCKLAAESHGGSIRFEAAVPRGSVFIVELPAWRVIGERSGG